MGKIIGIDLGTTNSCVAIMDVVVMPKPIRPSGAGLANLVLPIIPQNYH